ncbi:hypothetical protein [Achromobacter piechaudii]|uniref:Uncharacterized protein n=1 Tax=Achromobacter piechaudii ATCC 43553 TaxID=742159 RepID=D4XAS5_9BURK|nr:hypothetical protein [Achromobacter piechaudii]EFF76087.1 hypothetical protein HMPREF0004_2572 [Achromobacter piechaudii ATCC 43553]
MSRLSRPGARAGANARDLSSGLVAGGQHDENRGAQLATAGSRMDATENSMTEAKKKPDWERIESEYQAILSGMPEHGIERDIVQLFRESYEAGSLEDRIPMTLHDTVVYEMPLKFGRADIVIFHVDGSASVIEVKDGTKGYNHVVSGIGQAALYSVQLAMSKGSLRAVRKCLLWTSAGSVALDGVIEEACEQAGVVALPWQSMASLMASREAVMRVMVEGYGSSEKG